MQVHFNNPDIISNNDANFKVRAEGALFNSFYMRSSKGQDYENNGGNQIIKNNNEFQLLKIIRGLGLLKTTLLVPKY